MSACVTAFAAPPTGGRFGHYCVPSAAMACICATRSANMADLIGVGHQRVGHEHRSLGRIGERERKDESRHVLIVRPDLTRLTTR